MKVSKNITTLVLMISSLSLLIILQVFWLKSSYEKAFYDFRREATMLFRATVFDLRDSLLSKNIETVPADFHPGDSGLAIFTIRTDSVHWQTRKRRMAPKENLQEQSARVQVFVETGDSVNKDVLKPLASKIQHLTVRGQKGGNKNFIIRIAPDTLDRDSLKVQLEKAFEKAGITTPFVIHSRAVPEMEEVFGRLPSPMQKIFDARKTEGGESARIFGDSIETDLVRLNPVQNYSLSFFRVRRALISEILPQILFSLFIVIMITAAFTVLFRNIKAQQKLMALKNDFISNVTHELKTPVATVSVALEALKDFRAINDPKLTNEYLEMAQRELKRLSLMTEKILAASVFESKGVEFTPEQIDFNDLLTAVLESNAPIFEKRNADVTVTREGSNFTIFGSAEHLTSVIYNLVDNALKYSSDKPILHIHLAENDQEVTLTVQDQGIGVPAEYQKKIFEKFFRVPTGDVHTIKGYGLGLSHVASIVKSHNGKIEMTSEPGKGSRFTITLKKAREFKITLP